MINSQGTRAAIDRFREARRLDPEAAIFQEAPLNALGYQLLTATTPAAAIEVFRMNTELYPRSANVWDSLSEAYETAGDSARGVEFARKTLDALPGDTTLESNEVAILLRSDVRAHIEDAEKRLRDSKLFHFTSIRRGFAGGGFDGQQSLPKQMAVAAQMHIGEQTGRE